MNKSFLSVLLFLIIGIEMQAQTRFEFNGYVSGLGQGILTKDSVASKESYFDLTLHNRLNTAFYYSEHLSVHLELRNLFILGETVSQNPYYAHQYELDKGYFDLNFNWFENQNNFLTTQIDRIYIDYSIGKFDFALGRQRINWGRTLVWNPNDIFNTYSYYEVDYMERPGSDAFKALYYMGPASSIEGVVKLDSAGAVTAAVQTKVNTLGYDVQFIGGYANNTDFVFGMGWEGNLKKFGFRGEWTYYQPHDNFFDTTGVFLASISTDYLFKNNVMLQFEMLYNDPKSLIPMQSAASVLGAPATSKSLSFSEYNFFANVSYPINPIVTISCAGMYYTRYSGYFFMPSLDVLAANNVSLSLIYQYFNFEYNHQRNGTSFGFLRLKWNY